MGYNCVRRHVPRLVDTGRCPQRHIKNRAAFIAKKMTVFLEIWTITRRGAIEIHVLHEPARGQRLKAVVNRRQRDRRHPVFHPHKDLGRGRMIALFHDRLVHAATLLRQP